MQFCHRTVKVLHPPRSTFSLGAVVLTLLSTFFAAMPSRAQCINNWQTNSNLSGFDGPIYAATVWDPDGNGPLSPLLVVGGSFKVAGQATSVSNVAFWNGQVWQSLGAGLNKNVLALTVWNGNLIAGGIFTSTGDSPANGIAMWDGNAWQQIDAGIDGTVTALTVFQGNLIATGFFTTAGSTSANSIAQWNGSVWQALGPGLGGSFPYAQSLAVYNGELYVGGLFTSAGGMNCNYVARWNGSTWHTLGSGILGFGYITTMASYQGVLYLGGQFPDAGGTNAHDIATWDGLAWHSLGRAMNASPAAMCVFGDYLFVGGDFNLVPGPVFANKIAQWDGTVWQQLGIGMDADVYALTTYNGELIAGGDFTKAGGNNSAHVAEWGPTAPTISVQPSNQGVCQGDTIVFSVSATGVDPLAYRWRRGQSVLSNGGNISGADTANLTISPAAVSDADPLYNCVVSDACGANAISSFASLNVTASPTAGAGGPYSTCELSPVSLQGSAANYSNVHWTSSGSGRFASSYSLNAIYTPSIEDIAAGTVSLTLTANPFAPCTTPAISTVELIIQQNPSAYAGGPYSACEGTAALLIGSATHYGSISWTSSGTGTWSGSDTLTPSYLPSADDVASGSVLLTLTAAPVPPCATPATSSVTLTIQALPAISTGGPYTTCSTTPVSLAPTVSNSAVGVLWSTSGSGVFSNDRSVHATYIPSAADVSAGTCHLTLTATPSPPCMTPTIATVTLTIDTDPFISLDPIGATIGVGSPYTLSVNASGGDLNYQWMKAGNPIIGAVNSSYTISSAVHDDASAYSCVVSNGCGTHESQPAILDVNDQATVRLAAPPACVTGSQLVVSLNMSSATALVVGGQFFLQYNTSVLQFVQAAPSDSTFLRTLYQSINPAQGTIDYAVGVDEGNHGTLDNETMAFLTFNIIQDVCTPAAALVSWRSNGPNGAATKLSDNEGNEVLTNTVNLPAIKIDHTPPSITAPAINVQCVADIPSPATDLTTFQAIGGTAGDNCGLVTVDFVTDAPLAGGTCHGTVSRTYRAADACGNTSDFIQTIAIDDTIAPTISNPSTIATYFQQQSDAEDAAKAAALAAASDNCADLLTASASTNTDGCMAIISVTVSDPCGNESIAAEFGTHIDSIVPNFTTCTTDQEVAADSNCQAFAPDFTTGIVVSDNCTSTQDLIINQNPPVGTVLGIGPTPFSITVTDQAGNENTCEFTLAVADLTPPIINDCPADITTNVNSSNCTSLVTWTPPSATDNCGAASVEQISGPEPGSAFANGSITTIEYKATDSANLTSTCSFTLTVTASPDMNDDNIVDLLDVPIFANVLLGTDATAWRIARADTNCDGSVDGQDVSAFVSLLIP